MSDRMKLMARADELRRTGHLLGVYTRGSDQRSADIAFAQQAMSEAADALESLTPPVDGAHVPSNYCWCDECRISRIRGKQSAPTPAPQDGIDRHLASLATIKDGDRAKCCPECGSTEFKPGFDGERECKNCGQSWYADVAYEAAPQEPCRAMPGIEPALHRPGCEHELREIVIEVNRSNSIPAWDADSGDYGLALALEVARRVRHLTIPTASSAGVCEDWQDIATAPKDGTPVLVGITYRYQPYKPDGQRQMKAPGRWQRATDWGWENCDAPERYMPAPPSNGGEK